MSHLPSEAAQQVFETLVDNPDGIRSLADVYSKEEINQMFDEVQTTPGPVGPQGRPPTEAEIMTAVSSYIAANPPSKGADGARGSIFLGSFATPASLPAVNGTTVRLNDFAYVVSTASLYRAV